MDHGSCPSERCQPRWPQNLRFSIETGPNRHDLCRRPSFNFGVATILKLIATSPFQGTYASSTSKSFRHSGITLVFKTTSEVFTRISPDNSLKRLTKCGVGPVTDQPSDFWELFVTPFK